MVFPTLNSLFRKGMGVNHLVRNTLFSVGFRKEKCCLVLGTSEFGFAKKSSSKKKIFVNNNKTSTVQKHTKID